jgi:protease II
MSTRSLTRTAVLLALLPGVALGQGLDYPPSPRDGTVDVYHGVRVPDPYRWLEDEASDETQAWIAAQNDLTFAYLDDLPGRDRIEARLTELYDYERFGVPEQEGGRYFFTRNDGLQNQPVLYVADGLDAEPRVLIDPNTLTEDGTQALGGWHVSPDGRLIAYAISDGGSDWRIWRVRDVETGEDLPDELRHIKFSGVSWSRDSAGFYYSRYPLGEDGRADDQQAVRVFYHRLGDAQEDDALVHEAEVETHNPYASVTEDGRFLVIGHYEGYLANAVYFKRLEGTGAAPEAPATPVFDAWDARYSFLGNVGETLLFSTTLEAPNTRVIAVGAPNPDRVREVVPESEQALRSVSIVGRHIVAQYLEDARSRVRVFNLAGQPVREVDLPLRRLDRREHLFRRPEVDFDPDAYEARRSSTPQGRHAGADVHRPPQGHDARRRQPDAALRLRRVQRLAHPVVQPARCGWRWAGSTPCQPARRRRVRRGLAPGRHQGQQAERLRRLHRRGGVPDRERLHVRPRSWPSGRLATAACWSARA